MAQDTEIKISTIAMWIAIIIFLAIMAWWVLGSSLTTNIISLAISIIGVIVAWKGGEDIRTIKSNSFKILEKLEDTKPTK